MNSGWTYLGLQDPIAISVFNDSLDVFADKSNRFWQRWPQFGLSLFEALETKSLEETRFLLKKSVEERIFDWWRQRIAQHWIDVTKTAIQTTTPPSKE